MLRSLVSVASVVALVHGEAKPHDFSAAQVACEVMSTFTCLNQAEPSPTFLCGDNGLESFEAWWRDNAVDDLVFHSNAVEGVTYTGLDEFLNNYPGDSPNTGMWEDVLYVCSVNSKREFVEKGDFQVALSISYTRAREPLEGDDSREKEIQHTSRDVRLSWHKSRYRVAEVFASTNTVTEN